jgi:hypothetical protein
MKIAIHTNPENKTNEIHVYSLFRKKRIFKNLEDPSEEIKVSSSLKGYSWLEGNMWYDQDGNMMTWDMRKRVGKFFMSTMHSKF